VNPEGPDRLVRPYLITGGRTQPSDELPLETLIEATPHALDLVGTLRFEPRRVVELCRSPLSLAEVAARISVPLGVARVIVADLAAEDLLKIHRTVPAHGPDVPLLERLLDGLSSC
jgi:hypothetical protein